MTSRSRDLRAPIRSPYRPASRTTAIIGRQGRTGTCATSSGGRWCKSWVGLKPAPTYVGFPVSLALPGLMVRIEMLCRGIRRDGARDAVVFHLQVTPRTPDACGLKPLFRLVWDERY